MTRVAELAADSCFVTHSSKSHTPQQHEFPREEMRNNSETRDSAQPRDARALYARQLQQASRTAMSNLQNDSLLANSTWITPLTAAPAAISVMAFLLKTSSNPKVAGMTVSTLEVHDEKNTQELGKLP